MTDSLVVSAKAEDAPTAARWLARRLVAAGLADTRAEATAGRLERAWADLLPQIFPKCCRAQLLLLVVDDRAGALAVELVGERRGRIGSTVLEDARRLGITAEPEAGMDGLTRMRLTL